MANDTDAADDSTETQTADDSPTTAAERFPADGVKIEPDDRVWIDSGVVRSYSELGDGGSQAVDVVGVDADEMTVEYPNRGDTETATVGREHARVTDLEKGEHVTISYDSRYSSAERTTKTGTVAQVMTDFGDAFDGLIVHGDDGTTYSVSITGTVRSQDSRTLLGGDAIVERDDDTDEPTYESHGFEIGQGYARRERAQLEIARDALGRDDRDVCTDGGFPVDDPRAEWCDDCQRYRISCSHDD